MSEGVSLRVCTSTQLSTQEFGFRNVWSVPVLQAHIAEGRNDVTPQAPALFSEFCGSVVVRSYSGGSVCFHRYKFRTALALLLSLARIGSL